MAERSARRKASITFRMSAEELAQLREQAAAVGVPVQDLVYARVFATAITRPLRPGPTSQQELPLTG